MVGERLINLWSIIVKYKSNSTHSHQHSNISIEDSQQEE